MGVSSTTARPFTPFNSKPLQAEIDAWPAPMLDRGFVGEADVETYTVDYSGPAPRGVIVGRTETGARIVAMAAPEEVAVVGEMIANDPLGGRFTVGPGENNKSAIRAVHPKG